VFPLVRQKAGGASEPDASTAATHRPFGRDSAESSWSTLVIPGSSCDPPENGSSSWPRRSVIIRLFADCRWLEPAATAGVTISRHDGFGSVLAVRCPGAENTAAVTFRRRRHGVARPSDTKPRQTA